MKSIAINKAKASYNQQKQKTDASNNAGSYVCNECNNTIKNNNLNEHKDNCYLKYNDLYLNNAEITFYCNNKIKKVYSNEEINYNKHPSINSFFKLAKHNYNNIIQKIENESFYISTNKSYKLKDYFIKISKDIKNHLTINKEKIYFGKVVIFEDFYETMPVFRLSFQDLKDENINLKFKAYGNSQQPEIKKLYNQLLAIPSSKKRKVMNNSGHYTLGKYIFIRGVLKENTNNLYFTDIQDLWLCSED